jgi:ABC-type cobalamin/Fe3+-siderophores transport system ATPase subunit
LRVPTISWARERNRAMIEVSNLSYFIGRRPILADLNFSIEKNDFVLICGPNGAGKSTLLKILAGIIPITKGRVTANEKCITCYSRREMATLLSYLPQSDDFGLPILVKDILWAGRFPYRSFFKKLSVQDRDIFSEGVGRFELDNLLERNIQTLSGGERKKVLLASAFIQDVPVILLDEPLNALDPASAVHLIKMLQNLREQGKTILLVSHDIERFFSSANKILALKSGKKCYFGPKKFSYELFKEIYQVSFQQFTLGNREIIFLNE